MFIVNKGENNLASFKSTLTHIRLLPNYFLSNNEYILNTLKY